jgi:L-alanine-DL-glutamate epimerase-like enolase superfamily enzyme
LKITRVEPIVLRAGNVDTSRADGTQDAFIVRVHTDEGLVGIGEADTSPYVARTMIEMPSSHAVARGLGELLVGRDPLQIDRLWDAMYMGSYHYGRAGAALHTISAIDIALWDLAGKASGQPISELLGGRSVDQITVYASEVMPDSIDEAQRLAESAVARGYSAFKLGWGPLGRDLAVDERLILAVRESLGEDRQLMIDGGMAYSVRRAVTLLRRVEEARLYWFEEPLAADDYDGYRRLAAQCQVSLAAGEADSTIKPFRKLALQGRVDVLQPDLARCGGFSVGRQIADLSRELGVDVVPHCFSTAILVAASLQFVAALPRPLLSEFSIAESPFVSHLIHDRFELKDGKLAVPRDPGLGIELDDDMVQRYRVV